MESTCAVVMEIAVQLQEMPVHSFVCWRLAEAMEKLAAWLKASEGINQRLSSAEQDALMTLDDVVRQGWSIAGKWNRSNRWLQVILGGRMVQELRTFAADLWSCSQAFTLVEEVDFKDDLGAATEQLDLLFESDEKFHRQFSEKVMAEMKRGGCRDGKGILHVLEFLRVHFGDADNFELQKEWEETKATFRPEFRVWSDKAEGQIRPFLSLSVEQNLLIHILLYCFETPGLETTAAEGIQGGSGQGPDRTTGGGLPYGHHVLQRSMDDNAIVLSQVKKADLEKLDVCPSPSRPVTPSSSSRSSSPSSTLPRTPSSLTSTLTCNKQRAISPLSGAASPPYSLPEECLCPICGALFRDPIMLDSGHSFCRKCLRKWWSSNDGKQKICPLTRMLHDGPLTPNYALEKVTASVDTVLQHLHRLIHQVQKSSNTAAIVPERMMADETTVQAAIEVLKTDRPVLEVARFGVQPLVRLADDSDLRQMILQQGCVHLSVQLLNRSWLAAEEVLTLWKKLTMDSVAQTAMLGTFESTRQRMELRERRTKIAEEGFQEVLLPLIRMKEWMVDRLSLAVLANILEESNARHIVKTSQGVLVRELCKMINLQSCAQDAGVLTGENVEIGRCVLFLVGIEHRDQITLSDVLAALAILAQDDKDEAKNEPLLAIEKLLGEIRGGEDGLIESLREAVRDSQFLVVVLSLLSARQSTRVNTSALKILYEMSHDMDCIEMGVTTYGFNIVKRLLEMMEWEEFTMGGVFELSAQVLSNWIARGGATLRADLLRSGGIPKLVRMLRECCSEEKGLSEQRASARGDILHIFANLAGSDDVCRAAFCGIGTIELLVRILQNSATLSSGSFAGLMQKRMANEDKQNPIDDDPHGIVPFILAQLVLFPGCRKDLLACQGLRAIVNALRSRFKTLMFRANAAMALETLAAFDETSCKVVISEIEHPYVISILKGDVSLSARAAAAGLLAVMMRRRDGGGLLRNEAIVAPLVDWVHLTKDQGEQEQLKVIAAFRRVVMDTQCWLQIVKTKGGVDAVVIFITCQRACAQCKEIALGVLTTAIKKTKAWMDEFKDNRLWDGLCGVNVINVLLSTLERGGILVGEEDKPPGPTAQQKGHHRQPKDESSLYRKVPIDSDLMQDVAEALFLLVDSNATAGRQILKAGGCKILMRSLMGRHLAEGGEADPSLLAQQTTAYNVFDLYICGLLGRLMEYGIEGVKAVSEVGGAYALVCVLVHEYSLEWMLQSMVSLRHMASASEEFNQLAGDCGAVDAITKALRVSGIGAAGDWADKTPLSTAGDDPGTEPVVETICAIPAFLKEGISALSALAQHQQNRGRIISSGGIDVLIDAVFKGIEQGDRVFAEEAMEALYQVSRSEVISTPLLMEMMLGIIVSKCSNGAENGTGGGIGSLVDDTPRWHPNRSPRSVITMAVLERAIWVLRNMVLEGIPYSSREKVMTAMIAVLKRSWASSSHLVSAAGLLHGAISTLDLLTTSSEEREKLRKRSGLPLLVGVLKCMGVQGLITNGECAANSVVTCGTHILKKFMDDPGGKGEVFRANIVPVLADWLCRPASKNNGPDCMACDALKLLDKLVDSSLTSLPRPTLSRTGKVVQKELVEAMNQAECFDGLAKLSLSSPHSICKEYSRKLLDSWMETCTFKALKQYVAAADSYALAKSIR
ncbi:hypothetical protein CBR_g26301 [Chara braunii]|uniref:RING-type E3 ubiquitin transferase n=1 Tax=Chara braunii TaxID=69332 RepID=A0A388L7I2_CHABU|nr:hypothetical protein CBR_g26301 [Chara braunii]|eukprot:GBG78270.1 hypothetical protein CBR_g26301 [Chara braunii]